MYIPDEILPPITTNSMGTDPKLPSENNRWIGDSSAATKAEKYFDEALRKLALARFWMDKAEKTDEPEPDPVW